jgi:hypothetical protein
VSARASKRSRGYPYPLVLQARLATLSDDTPPPVLLEPPAPPQPGISEEDFQEVIVGLATTFRWLSWHDNDSRRNDGGLPDLIIIRERVLWRELKAERGKLKPEQAAWGQRLLRCGQDWGIWRPSDWLTEIVPTLTAQIRRQD